jgi:2-polyprenyl-6-methoxyphenol hydroxylase-like FAD-dependent oxidoreductase
MADAVVVGAGIGGLAVAGALARRGWDVTLIERGERLRADRAALLLWPSALAALRELGLGDGLDAIAYPVASSGIRRPDGNWLVRAEELAGAETPLVVHREDLHDALIAGLTDRVDIRTGVSVRTLGASGSRRPTVGDGTSSWDADVVIAADGVDSVIRRRLAPDATVVSAGCTAWRAVIPWFRAVDLADRLDRLPTGGLAGETLGAGHRFRYASLGTRGSAGESRRGGIYWAATVPGATRPESAAAQIDLLRRRFADWHAPIGDLIAATDPDDLIQHSVNELWPLPGAFAFHAGGGGYALLGDAAHAMAHHLSQGAGLALDDAAALVRLLGQQPVPAALDAYTQERRPAVLRVGRQSRRVGAVLSASRVSVARTRDAALGLAPGLMGRATGAIRQLRRSS